MDGRWGGSCACSVQGKAKRLPARAKCTSNITSKFMTSDTSKLSGWLNAVASYRTARGAYRTARGAAGPRMCSVQGK
eukprot:scaffold24764_cov60-Phaeocystis_antarctica.AAC.7